MNKSIIYILGIIILEFFFINVNAQQKNSFDLDKALKDAEKEEKSDQRNYRYAIKFDKTFKPHLYISYINTFHKTSTSYKFKIVYSKYGDNTVVYSLDKMVNKNINYQSQAHIIIMLKEKDFGSDHFPKDLVMKNVSIRAIRFADASVLNKTIDLYDVQSKNKEYYDWVRN